MFGYRLLIFEHTSLLSVDRIRNFPHKEISFTTLMPKFSLAEGSCFGSTGSFPKLANPTLTALGCANPTTLASLPSNNMSNCTSMSAHCPVCPASPFPVLVCLWSKPFLAGGDASMEFLAQTQDPEMADLKNQNATTMPSLDSASMPARDVGLIRGRTGYNQLGAIRTKPGSCFG